MYLETVSVKKYRSIDASELLHCGGFNVLIGKNNAGKSALLFAIDAFFVTIRKGQVVDVNPSFGRDIDYFERSEAPIDLTLIFILSRPERDKLIRDIVADAPQMKNAAEGLDP